jgi:hypothetical protein
VGRSAAKSCGRGRPVRTALRERVRARVQGCAHVERRCTDGGRRLFRALVEDLYRRVQLPPSWVSRLTEELEHPHLLADGDPDGRPTGSQGQCESDPRARSNSEEPSSATPSVRLADGLTRPRSNDVAGRPLSFSARNGPPQGDQGLAGGIVRQRRPPPLAAESARGRRPACGQDPDYGPPPFAGTPRFLALRRKGSRHAPGTRGTPWGVNGDSDPSQSARQQQKSRRSTGSPRAGSEATASSPSAVGSGSRAEICGDTGAMVHIASRASEQTAPNPGTSWRGTLGDTGGRTNARTAERTGPEHPGERRG